MASALDFALDPALHLRTDPCFAAGENASAPIDEAGKHRHIFEVDVVKLDVIADTPAAAGFFALGILFGAGQNFFGFASFILSLIHISEPTRPY